MGTTNSLVYPLAYQFAIRIVKAYKHLTDEKREFVLSKQMLKSGTSIGANIAEANGAISKAEFRAKMSISYKESLETKYWLSIYAKLIVYFVPKFIRIFSTALTRAE